MRAVIASRSGGPGVLEIADLPDPEPAAEQVRIRVEAASVTFFDTTVLSGSQIGPRTTFPVVPGNGVGGVVDAVGPEADTDWLDRRVVATTGGTGGYASLALAPAAALHRVPEQLDVATAAAMLADGRTAVGLHEESCGATRRTQSTTMNIEESAISSAGPRATPPIPRRTATSPDHIQPSSAEGRPATTTSPARANWPTASLASFMEAIRNAPKPTPPVGCRCPNRVADRIGQERRE